MAECDKSSRLTGRDTTFPAYAMQIEKMKDSFLFWNSSPAPEELKGIKEKKRESFSVSFAIRRSPYFTRAFGNFSGTAGAGHHEIHLPSKKAQLQ